MKPGYLANWLLLLTCCPFLAVAAASWQGRPVIALLEDLTAQGYRIIYSSDVVSDELLVLKEPDLSDPLSGLESVLESHHLDLTKGPMNTWLVRVPRADPLVAVSPQPVEVPLAEIVVTSSLNQLQYTQSGTQTYLDRELATRIPAAAEEATRITSRLPGTAGGGISSRNHIRGGEVNEVLFLLDGLRLYEPFHLKDFQSVATIVNSNAIDGIDFFTGAYPAKFGDRMSGVMNISLRSPREDSETELALSFFNTSALSIGRFGGGGRGDWLLAARRSNLDLIADVIDPDVGSPDYQDYLVHAGWEFGPKARLSINMLSSRDKLSLYDVARGEAANAGYDNTVFWLKWDADWSDTLRSTTIFSSSSISNRRNGQLDLPGIVTGAIDDQRKFASVGLKQDWVFAPKKNWMVSFGLDVKHQDARYDVVSNRTLTAPFDSILDNQANEVRSVSATPEGSQYGVWFEYRWQPSARLTIDSGVRWDSQTYTTADNDEQSSPRVSVLYRPDDRTDIRVGWGQFSQAQEINELQANDGIDSFYPAQRAEHVVANVEHLFGNDLYVDISYYRKSFRSVRPRYENAFNALTLLPEIQFDRYRIEPESGAAQGAELRVAKGESGADFLWWLGYSWSEVRDKAQVTRTYRSWDQTHAVKAGASWHWRNWDLSVAGEVHTGWPRTELAGEEVPNPDGTWSLQVATTPFNSGRYSVFHTMDIRASRDFALRRGDLTVFVEVSNLYDRKNPCCTEYSIDLNGAGPTLIARERGWLPLVPSLGVVWRF